MNRSGWPMFLSLVLVAGAPAARAATAWDETLQGDFSGDGLVPTALGTLMAGSNAVLGTTGNAGAGVDLDYFTFTVPAGATWTQLRLLANTTVSGGASFIGVQAGPQLTVSPSGVGADQLLGFAHYSSDMVGSDLMPFFSTTGTLASGTYAVWVQETGGPVDYGFDFKVSVVPEPAASVLALAGLLGLGALMRARAGR